MRAASVIILLILAAGIGYVIVFQWDWVSSMWEEGRQNLSGFTAAKSPEEAMDQFEKAIEKRDYKAAAKYCTGKYSDQLLKGANEAYAVGSRIDQLKNLMTEKGLMTTRSKIILFGLDPFPALFTRSTEKAIEEGKDDPEKRYGWYVSEVQDLNADVRDITGMDTKMFVNALMPPNSAGRPELTNTPGFFYRVEIVNEGQGDAQDWKLNIPLDQYTESEINHLIEQHKKYVNALDTLIASIRSEAYPSGVDFEKELIEVMQKQNEK